MTYPVKYSRKVLVIRKNKNLTIAKVTDRFYVGIATVVRWIKQIALARNMLCLPFK